MPQYEFKCLSCSYKFTELTEYNEEYPKCPKCNENTKKVPSVCISRNHSMCAKEHKEKVIDPEVQEIKRKIQAGDEDACADIMGEENMFIK